MHNLFRRSVGFVRQWKDLGPECVISHWREESEITVSDIKIFEINIKMLTTNMKQLIINHIPLKIHVKEGVFDMKIVVLDGYTENPGDLSWEGLKDLGELTVYDRTPVGDAGEIIRCVYETADILPGY